MNDIHIMYKGGCGGHYGIRHAVGVPARHHHWTGTTDEPRSLVPPSDGGLDKPPSKWKRLKRWIAYYLRWGKPNIDRHSAEARKQREQERKQA